MSSYNTVDGTINIFIIILLAVSLITMVVVVKTIHAQIKHITYDRKAFTLYDE